MGKTSEKFQSAEESPRLTYRTYRGKEDIPLLVKRENECWKADLIDMTYTEEDMEAELSHPINFDPNKDIIFADIDGKYAGHSIVSWQSKPDSTRLYFLYAFISAEWRGKGVREVLMCRAVERIKEIASEHPANVKKYIETYSNADANDWKSLLERENFTPGWHLLEMVRPNLDNIPDLKLPSGVEVRPVLPEHYKIIWEAMKEAFKDERSFSEDRYGDKAFERHILSSSFKPDIWCIAWAGNNVVGGVHNYINEEENRDFNRKWGHTERIFVSREWRRKGVARALIAKSLEVLKEQGMEQATLDVDTENPSGAFRVYESLGYVPRMHFIFYRKRLV